MGTGKLTTFRPDRREAPKKPEIRGVNFVVLQDLDPYGSGGKRGLSTFGL